MNVIPILHGRVHQEVGEMGDLHLVGERGHTDHNGLRLLKIYIKSKT
jgi:hypothetical protein